MNARFLFTSILGLTLLAALVSPSGIQASILNPQSSPSGIELPLTSIGLQDGQTLQGPLDQVVLQFSLPPEWTLQPGATLNLDLNDYFASLIPTPTAALPKNIIMGELSVWINGVKIGSQFLKDAGDFSLIMNLDEKSFTTSARASVNELIIKWDAATSCSYEVASIITIKSTSRLILPYQTTTLIPDLSVYPWPFYAQKAIKLPMLTLVVPDQATAGELQSAMTVAASLGSVSQDELQFNLLTMSELTETEKKENNFIFIGISDHLAQFSDAIFNGSVPNQLSKVQADGEDGILLEVNSPWNAERMTLLVSGKSDTAVIKAAQALSSGKLVTATQDSLSIVKDVQEPAFPTTNGIDTLFSELNQDTVKFTEFGKHQLRIPFYISESRQISPDATLDLYLNHSKLIDYSQSGLWVSLNGIPIGSVRFSDQTADTTLVRIIIPPSVVKPLRNEVEIEVNLASFNSCPDPASTDHWVMIFGNSDLHLPEVDQPAGLIAPLMIGDYPLPFINESGLGTTTLVVEKDDPQSWQSAALLFYDLGKLSNNPLYQPELLFADQLSEAKTADRQLVILGLSNKIPFSTKINDSLPVPFKNDGTLQENIQTLTGYSTSPGQTMGMIEVLNRSTSPMRESILVLGSTAQGLQMAVKTLTDPNARKGLMAANFALIQEKNVIGNYIPIVKNPANLAGGVKPTQSMALSLTLLTWIALIVTLLALLGLLIYSLIHSRQQKSPPMLPIVKQPKGKSRK